MAHRDANMAARDKITPEAPAEVLFDMGLAYYFGKGVEEDIREAHKWFNLAAIRGHGKARQYRSELAAEMDTAELREALARAREWIGLN